MRSVDAGLHAALRRRGLLDFAWMSDAALLNNAGRMMEFGAIVDAHALKGTQPVLYAALCKRGLLEGLCLQKEEGQDAAGTVAGRTAAVISP